MVAHAAPARSDIANVAVVVRFAGQTQGEGPTGLNKPHLSNPQYTYWDAFKERFTSSGTPYFANYVSLDEYVDLVSYNQLRVHNFFPEEDGGRVNYITLPHSFEYYAQRGDVTTVARDTVKALAANLNKQQWDMNNDGRVDNLTVVMHLPDGAPKAPRLTTSKHVLWQEGPVDGLDLERFNIHAMTMDNTGISLGSSPGVVQHEFMHTLGIWDLYRFEDENIGGSPVGFWDIMSKAGLFYPLAQHRQDLGFLEIPAVQPTPEGIEVELATPDSGPESGRPYAVRVSSPFSETESFVIEYRPNDRRKVLDKFPGNNGGVIIYRVNQVPGEDKPSNLLKGPNGQPLDYLYVFRPGQDTVVSATNPQDADLHQGDSYGSLNMADTIAQNAIVDSHNRNSGIQVTVEEATKEGARVTIKQTSAADLDFWEKVAGSGVDPVNHDNGALLSLGNKVYRAVRTSRGISVDVQEGGEVTPVGSIASGTSYAPTLFAREGQAYVAFGDNQGRVNIARIGQAAVTQVRSVETGLGYEPKVFAGSGPNAGVVVDTGTVLKFVGPQEGQDLPDLRPGGNTVVDVAWNGDSAVLSTFDPQKTFEYRLEGGSWRQVSSADSMYRLVHSVNLRDKQLTLLSTGNDEPLRLRYEGQEVTTNLPAFAADDLVAVGDNVYALLHHQNTGLLKVYKASVSDLGTWTQVGEDVANTQVQAQLSVVGGVAHVLVRGEQVVTFTNRVEQPQLAQEQEPAIKQVKPHPVPALAEVPSARSFVTNADALPDGTEFYWEPELSFATPGTKRVELVTRYGDGSKDRSALTFNVSAHADFYAPTATATPRSVTFGDPVPAPAQFAEGVPAGATLTWAAEPSTSQLGRQTGSVQVTYADGTSERLEVHLFVSELAAVHQPKFVASASAVALDSAPDAREFVSNLGSLPGGTGVSWEDEPVLATPGRKTAKVVVSYPDGSKDQATVTFEVASHAETFAPVVKQVPPVMQGQEAPPADSFVEFPEEPTHKAEIKWRDQPSTATPGVRSGAVIIRYADGSSQQVKVEFHVKPSAPEVPAPEEPQAPEPIAFVPQPRSQEVARGAALPKARLMLSNADQLPAGATVSWKTVPDLNTAGEQAGSVVVSLHGKDIKDIVVPVVVHVAAAGEQPPAGQPDEGQPQPSPAPEPEPSPAPDPDPVPAPEPEPSPAPQPDPDPDPVPAPEPEPSPAPQPDPAPGRVPDPQAEDSSSTGSIVGAIVGLLALLGLGGLGFWLTQTPQGRALLRF
ncbi:hypothetical protein CPHO_00230 [Corynebacterium phocae]|uniref:Rib domain-containing protein n=1 Tax=Corynebacterium phocae TaxID=161895 RepID=A0A1L7D0E3_9CORY|nr:hypothetical protein CPHO_00230 [Corynebacterium phocae]